jgi:phage terminase small subunit
MKKPRKPTPRQARFVEEYLIDLNATQAAIRAGYSAKRADAIGYELLRKPEIQEAIQAAMDARSRRTGITADRVLDELRKVAFGDARRVMSWGPGGVKLIDSAELSGDDAAIVAEAFESITKDGGSIRLKTHDKLKALELLGRHLGMFVDKRELTGKDGKDLSAVVVYVPDNGRGSAEEGRDG